MGYRAKPPQITLPHGRNSHHLGRNIEQPTNHGHKETTPSHSNHGYDLLMGAGGCVSSQHRKNLTRESCRPLFFFMPKGNMSAFGCVFFEGTFALWLSRETIRNPEAIWGVPVFPLRTGIRHGPHIQGLARTTQVSDS